jgi:hypothetical protein
MKYVIILCGKIPFDAKALWCIPLGFNGSVIMDFHIFVCTHVHARGLTIKETVPINSAELNFILNCSGILQVVPSCNDTRIPVSVFQLMHFLRSFSCRLFGMACNLMNLFYAFRL